MTKFKLETKNNTWIGEQMGDNSWKVSIQPDKRVENKIVLQFQTGKDVKMASVLSTVASFEEEIRKL